MIEPSLLLIGKGLFGVPASFILVFFLKLSVVFLISGIMSKIFRLDKYYDEMKDQKKL